MKIDVNTVLLGLGVVGTGAAVAAVALPMLRSQGQPQQQPQPPQQAPTYVVMGGDSGGGNTGKVVGDVLQGAAEAGKVLCGDVPLWECVGSAFGGKKGE